MAKHKKPVPTKTKDSSSMLSSLSPTKQDLLCVLLLYLITLLFFREIVFNNAAFATEGDTAAAHSYFRVGNTIQQTEGIDPLWMPFFFSGMPTFGNLAYVPHDVSYIQTAAVWVLNFFFLKGAWTWLVVHYFFGGVFMFLLMRVLNFSRLVSLFAAFTFMLTPYAIGLAGEGHGSKLMALNYLPLAFLLTHLVVERRDLLSFGLLSASIGTLLLTRHVQIAYYVFILIGLYVVFQIAVNFGENRLRVAKSTALFIGAMALGLAISSYIYLSVYEFAPYSIRGGGGPGASSGLTWDYATNWSWHPAELLTLFVPGFFGMKVQYYWGFVEPWTNSSVYVGLVPIFFGVIALSYRRNAMTIFITAVTILIILVAFGRNLAFLYNILFTYLPYFNKFRAPAMILHLLPFLLALLGAYGFTFLYGGEHIKEDQRQALAKRLLYGTAVLAAGAVLVLLLKSWLYDILSGSFFFRESELTQAKQQYGQQASRAIAQLKQARFDIFWKDLVKFFLLAVAICGSTVYYLRGKIRAGTYAAAILAVTLIDLWIVSGKYITPVPSSNLEKNFAADATIGFLKEQRGVFRIFPVTPESFMDNTYAYNGIQSIGGYSPAKLKIYQTMLDSTLYAATDSLLPWNLNILNMLNVRYLLVPGRLPGNRFEIAFFDQSKRLVTYENRSALPRAWYASNVVVAPDDHQTFAALNSPTFDPARTAIVGTPLSQPVTPQDSSARLRITEYQSRRISLTTETAGTALMVLSEVYYPAGWKAFIDGQEAEIIRTNYVLRSVVIPSGVHNVVFSYDPPLYRAGWIITNVAWGVAGLCILGGLWQLPAVRRRLRRKDEKATEPAPNP